MTGRFLALALIATAPFLAPVDSVPGGAFHLGAASGFMPAWAQGHGDLAPDRLTGWSITRDGLAAIGHRVGGGMPLAGATYFIDAASLADVTFTIGTTTVLRDAGSHDAGLPDAGLQDAGAARLGYASGPVTAAAGPGSLLTPGLTLVLNRGF